MVAGVDSQGVIEPVRKVVHVQLSIVDAYRLFTEDMSSWWPLESHSIGAEKTERCVFEGYAGGRIYEVEQDGSEADWGKVKVWDPPHAVTFTWYPGREENTAQDVEVRFRSLPEGTELELIHHGWELLGDKAEETRAGYDSGWDFVLGEFIAAGGE